MLVFCFVFSVSARARNRGKKLSGTKPCCLVIRKRSKCHLNKVESPKKKNYSRGFVGHCHQGNRASKRLSKRQFCSTFFSVNYLGWNQEIEWLQGKSSGLTGQKSSLSYQNQKKLLASLMNSSMHLYFH